MAADNKLELVIQVDAAGANASIKSVNKSLSGLEKEAVSTAKGASKGIEGMTLSMTKAVVAGNAIYDAAKRAFAALNDFTLGAIETQDEMGKTAQKLGAMGRSNAALLGGGLLALAGLQRGGLSVLGMTTAGGALIGFKFGGPLGAAIGAGIGAIAGTIRLFVKSAEDKAREKIKATYGVEIKDKGVLRQIVEMAKQGFGGNLDMAIRSQQVRDLIELYAMTTGQSTGGLPAKVSPVSLVQTGGALFQQPGFSNGSLLSSFGGALPTIGLDRIGVGSPTNAGPMVINITVPGAKEFFEKETVRVVVENPRAVQSAALSAIKANAGRRELTSLQLSPGTLAS